MEDKVKWLALPVIVPSDLTGSTVHAGVHSTGIIRNDTLLDFDKVNLSNRFWFDNVIEIKTEQFDDSRHISTVANL